MKIPIDVSATRAKLKAVFSKPLEKKPSSTGDEAKRQFGAEAAKERQKRKDLMAKLASVETTAAEKQSIIDGLNAQLDAVQTELETHKALAEELAPAAKQWKAYEHKERTKLIDSFPVEKRKAVGKIADSLSIEDFREYATSLTGTSKTESTQQQGKDGKKDWNAILQSEKADKEIAADTKGFNEFMDSQK